MPKHARPQQSAVPRALARAAFTVAVMGAAVATAGTANAESTGESLNGALTGLTQAKDFSLNPMAGSSFNPLDNAVTTQVSDFQPVSTTSATEPLAEGDSAAELPLIGQVIALLPG